MADHHPTPEQLYAARRDPRGAAAGQALAHASACARCAEELARQDAFDQPEPVSQDGLDAAWERFAAKGDAEAVSRAPRRPAASRWNPALALAATLAAAVLGLTLLWPMRPTALPVDTPIDTDLVRGGGELAGFWSPTGVVEAPPAELVFPAPDGEPRRVTVYDAGAYRWTSEPATGGRIPFPAAERQRLKPGTEYFWTVLDGDEAVTARSFTLRPSAMEGRGPT